MEDGQAGHFPYYLAHKEPLCKIIVKIRLVDSVEGALRRIAKRLYLRMDKKPKSLIETRVY